MFLYSFHADSFLTSGYKFGVKLSKGNTTLVYLNLPDDETRRYFVDMTKKSKLETHEVDQQNVFS